jgi:hypothetical protein
MDETTATEGSVYRGARPKAPRMGWRIVGGEKPIDVIVVWIFAAGLWAILYVAFGWEAHVARGVHVLGAFFALWLALFLRRVPVKEGE